MAGTRGTPSDVPPDFAARAAELGALIRYHRGRYYNEDDPMTPAQLSALKADILADPILAAQPMTPDGAFAIADAYNLAAVPAFTVWRTSVSAEQVMANGFIWTAVDSLTVGKARIWDWLSLLGALDASQSNIRAGIDATWVGTQADLAVRAAVYVVCKRLATRAERLFATGTGTDAAPGTMAFEGILSVDDVQQARELP